MIHCKMKRVLTFGLYIIVLLILYRLQSYRSRCKSDSPYILPLQQTYPRTLNNHFSYIIQNNGTCSNNEDITIVFVICTRPDNFVAREVLRKTWLNSLIGNKGKLRYTFLIGMKTGSEEYKRQLKTESDTYRDILQESFIDSYDNLTLKTVMGFKWASKYCPSAKYVMKVDDDVYVNIDNLLKSLEFYGKFLLTSIGGLCLEMPFPYRNEGHKNHLSYEEYPYHVFPPYCSGTGYITSGAVAKDLSDVSSKINYLNIEDVYVGACLSYLGYGWTQIPGFAVVNTESVYCVNSLGHSIITVHPLSPSELLRMWDPKCRQTQSLLHISHGLHIL